ncbi:nucleotide exchange factor GrpE [Spirillospora sp. CA-255316]
MSSARDRRVSEGSAPAAPAPPPAPAEDEGEGAAAPRTVAEAAARPAPPPAAPEPDPDPDADGDPEEPGPARDEIIAAIAELAGRLDREHERAAHREAIIDRLHEENQALRRGEIQSAFEPVRGALYRLHDMARREAARWAGPEPPDPAHAAALFAAVADEVADALARTGAERFTVEPGAPYDPARHRPVAAEPVADPAAAGMVVGVRSDGFERDGRVVRKAEVTVGTAAEDGPFLSSGSSGLRENGRGETMRPGPCA